MAKIRIYELARTLNMTNKDLLAKLKDMGLDVKSHMSSVESDIADKVRDEVFGTGGETSDVIEQKRVGSNVIRKRKQKPRTEEPKPQPPVEKVSTRTKKTSESEEETLPEPSKNDPTTAAENDAADIPQAETTTPESPPSDKETTEAKAEKTAAEDKEAPAAGKPTKKKAKSKKQTAARIIKF